MAYVQLEDETASCEAVMFAKEIPEQFPPPNTIVVAYLNIGKSFDGSTLSVRVESIKPLEDVRREIVKKICLSIRTKRTAVQAEVMEQKRLLKELKDLITAHPGDTPFSVDLDFGDARLAIESGGRGIDLNDLFYQNIKGLSAHGIGLNY